MREVIAIGCGVPRPALLRRALDLAVDRPSYLLRGPVKLVSVVILEGVGKGDVLLVGIYCMSVQQAHQSNIARHTVQSPLEIII